MSKNDSRSGTPMSVEELMEKYKEELLRMQNIRPPSPKRPSKASPPTAQSTTPTAEPPIPPPPGEYRPIPPTVPRAPVSPPAPKPRRRSNRSKQSTPSTGSTGGDTTVPTVATPNTVVGTPSITQTTMTTSSGHPIYSDTQSLTVGADGFTLLSDVQLVDKLAHFDRERIPERVVHAKGAGAFGNFTLYNSMKDFTSANFLQTAGAITPVFTRFSTVIGSKGSADTARDPRGFAVKFYTNEGVYDIVGLNFPVFFIRDAIQFPDVIHSLKPNPKTNLHEPKRLFEYLTGVPEATMMLTFLYSDEGTVDSYRHMNGFGVNTYIWVNSVGKRHLVKYHWVTQQEVRTLNRDEAMMLAGADPDIATRDLHNAIAAGEEVKYELCVQLLDPDLRIELPFDPLDDTKIWPEDMFPLIPVGMLTLNQNPENFFAQVEQSAFCPSNVVPGIELSADKMLTGRAFSYTDAQRHRVGTNFMQLPINQPKSAVLNNQQDGSMRYNFSDSAQNYPLPNSPTTPLATPPTYYGLPQSGYIGRYTIAKTDDFTQAGERFRSMDASAQEHLIKNLSFDLATATDEVIAVIVSYFMQADTSLGLALSEAVATIKAKEMM